LIAVVRLRKRNEWVLPKGKLDDGETPRAAAEREVLEETGHEVAVHEFLGTLVYESGGGSKVVHYWRMEAVGEQVHELMNDVKAVEWLPLDAAVERLSRGYERAFLANVGPLALEAAAIAPAARRSRAKQPVLEKRRVRQIAKPPATVPIVVQPQPDLTPPAIEQPERPAISNHVVEPEPSVPAVACETTPLFAKAESAAPVLLPESSENEPAPAARGRRAGVVQKLQDWLRRIV
jgi:8-oxo-dGTP diphosphatase